jgi:N-methylhydantoinase A
MAAKTLRIATDVGGTFTDMVCLESDPATGVQLVVTAKADTTPPDFECGVLDVLAKGNVAPSDIQFFAHGTTVVINALTERKGARVGLVTTKGFRDVLEIARGNRPDFFNLLYRKPEPFVPRYLRREIAGRLNYKGGGTEPLDLAPLAAIVADFQAAGVQAVAICLLHAYANPAHERAVAAALRALWPEVRIVASHQITREWREYERTSTTVLSAFVQPVAERYLERLSDGLTAGGFSGNLYIMQSNCGVETLEATKAIPITMVESGPASGFWAAAALGRLAGAPNVLALDIGGTTAKCSLIENGEIRIKTDYWIERDRRSAGYPIMVPVVDLVEIGNGGGSIASVDPFGVLKVGPRSAGAWPGPAAYGRGGTDATTTDANLALGRINPDFFCGGEKTADMIAVETALDRLAARLGASGNEVARGIVRVANANMVNALKLVSVNRGYDPRDFTLVAFGGGGGLHASALARELGMRHVIVPRAAPVFSAWGMMMSDLRRDYFVTRVLRQNDLDAVNALIGASVQEALSQFAGEGVHRDRVVLRPFLKCRYLNQENAVEIGLGATALDAAGLEDAISRFHAIYEREYTYRLGVGVEIVGLHLVATAEIGKLQPAEVPRTGALLSAALKGRRGVDYMSEGLHEAAIYDAARLEPEMVFSGPAVIEDPGTTIVIHPGDRVRIDRHGNVDIEVPA